VDQHDDIIRDQFTQQAVPFATASGIQDPYEIGRIVRLSGAGSDDEVLDVACGPGVVTCAFARVARHATGLDLTPAMLDQARAEQSRQRLSNVSWDLGNAAALPYRDGRFSIVVSRFALHHVLDPLRMLLEMVRVCRPAGRVVVVDSAPEASRAEAFNAMERLRDPSHVRALPVEELVDLFTRAGLGTPEVEICRLAGELDDLLGRSFPVSGDERRIREMFTASIEDDALGMSVARRAGQIVYAFRVAVLAAGVPVPGSPVRLSG
jgi:SAM-dependent methyltransferase